MRRRPILASSYSFENFAGFTSCYAVYFPRVPTNRQKTSEIAFNGWQMVKNGQHAGILGVVGPNFHKFWVQPFCYISGQFWLMFPSVLDSMFAQRWCTMRWESSCGHFGVDFAKIHPVLRILEQFYCQSNATRHGNGPEGPIAIFLGHLPAIWQTLCAGVTVSADSARVLGEPGGIFSAGIFMAYHGILSWWIFREKKKTSFWFSVTFWVVFVSFDFFYRKKSKIFQNPEQKKSTAVRTFR